MPKANKPVVPLYPLLHTARDSLDAALFESGMLLEATETYLSIAKPTGKAVDRLQERCARLRVALFGADAVVPDGTAIVDGPRRFPTRK